jgi:hypothetical protein
MVMKPKSVGTTGSPTSSSTASSTKAPILAARQNKSEAAKTTGGQLKVSSLAHNARDAFGDFVKDNTPPVLQDPVGKLVAATTPPIVSKTFDAGAAAVNDAKNKANATANNIHNMLFPSPPPPPVIKPPTPKPPTGGTTSTGQTGTPNSQGPSNQTSGQSSSGQTSSQGTGGNPNGQGTTTNPNSQGPGGYPKGQRAGSNVLATLLGGLSGLPFPGGMSDGGAFGGFAPGGGSFMDVAGGGAASMPTDAGGFGATLASGGDFSSPGVVTSDALAAMNQAGAGPVVDGGAVASTYVAQPIATDPSLAGPVATPDVGQADPAVVPTSTNSATQAPAPSAPSDPSGSAVGRLTLVNPQDSGGAVNYALDGHAYTIEPGSTQDMTVQGPCLVEFDRGNDGASARYSLTSGSYTFTVTDKGWELYNTTFNITLDNTSNNGDFYYSRDGREESVPARGTQKLTDRYPIQISFDRGDRGEPAQCTLDNPNGTYCIALREDQKALDLIPKLPR